MNITTEVKRRAVVVGAAGGFACGGFVHGMLAPGSAWVRAAETGFTVAVAGVLIGCVVLFLARDGVDDG